MSDINIALIAAGLLAGLVVGWVSRKFWASKGPTEKALALKVGIAAMTKIAKMNSATPEQAAQMAAAAAHEAALLDAFKDAAAKL
jgi:hypothetical protein